MAPQHVELLDEVCWFFPELVAQPPRLHVGLRPPPLPPGHRGLRQHPGASKVLFAGCFPSGLTYERTFAELAQLPLRDEVWPAFLRDNATRVFGLA